MQQFGLYEHQLSEIEVVSYASFLVVYCRMGHRLALDDAVTVAIYQCGISVRRHAKESFGCVLSEYERCVFYAQQHIFGLRVALNFDNCLCGCRVVSNNHIAVCRQFLIMYEVSVYYQIYVAYGLVVAESLERVAHFRQIKARQETVYLSSHFLTVLF